MKILFISSLFGINGGGAGIIADNLAHRLAEAGHQVSVVTTNERRHSSVTQDRNIRILRFRPLNLYPLEKKDSHFLLEKVIWQLADIYNFHSASVFRKVLINESPDIIHIHKMRGFSGAVWSVASRLCPGRIIQTCHDYESMSPDGYMRGYVGQMALRQQWPVRGYQLIRSHLSRGVSVVTAPSNFALKRVVDSGLFPSAQPKVVFNTHGWAQNELKSIHKSRNLTMRKHVQFLYLGRLELEKGIMQLCEAFTQAFRVNPNMRLEIAGWGTLEAELHRKYGQHPGINFLGAVYGKSKEDALKEATIVVVPSTWEEVFGIVVVEAYAFGTPVIASKVGGLSELVKHGETGWLVEAGSVEALTEQLKEVVNTDPVLLAKMSQKCEEYSYEFTTEKIVTEYLDVYYQMIK